MDKENLAFFIMRKPGRAVKSLRPNLGSMSQPSVPTAPVYLSCSTTKSFGLSQFSNLKKSVHVGALQRLLSAAPETLLFGAADVGQAVSSALFGAGIFTKSACHETSENDELVRGMHSKFNLELKETVDLIAPSAASPSSSSHQAAPTSSCLSCSSDCAALLLALSIARNRKKWGNELSLISTVTELCQTRRALVPLSFRVVLHALKLVGFDVRGKQVELQQDVLSQEVDRLYTSSCQVGISGLERVAVPPADIHLRALVCHVSRHQMRSAASGADRLDHFRMMNKLVSAMSKLNRMTLLFVTYDELRISGLLRDARNHGEVSVAATLLIAAGHVSDVCEDWQAANVSANALQMCSQLCDLCVASATSKIYHTEFDEDGKQKLSEALRLGIKLLLKAQALPEAIALYEQSPELVGPSWELVECYSQRHLWGQAFDVAAKFVRSVWHKFSTNGLPGPLRAQVLRALKGLGGSPVEGEEILRKALLASSSWKVVNVPLASVLGEIIEGVASRPDHQLVVRLVEWYAKQPLLGSRHGMLHTTVAHYVAALTYVYTDEQELISFTVSKVQALQHNVPNVHADVIAINTLVDAGWTNVAAEVLQYVTRLDVVAMRQIKTITLRALLGGSAQADDCASPLFKESKVINSIRAAIALRDAEEETKKPWECILCKTWNGRSDAHCRVCRSLQMSLWKCGTCGGFSPARRGDSGEVMASDQQCLICEAKAPEKIELLPLRPWSCRNCQTKNTAHNAFFCTSCNKKSLLAKDVKSFFCHSCGFNNAHGILKPWCGRCGDLHPAAASSPKSLWRCTECRGVNPWLLNTCRCCSTAARPPNPEEIPWTMWTCTTCEQANAPWLTRCSSCDADQLTVDVETTDGPVSTLCHICGDVLLSLGGGSVCLHCSSTCGSRVTGSDDDGSLMDTPASLFAPEAESIYPIWLCLHGGCLQGNTAQSLSCTRCLKPRSKSNGVGATAGMIFGYTSAEQDEASIEAIPTSVTLRTSPEHHHRCVKCDELLCPTTNLALVCNECLSSSLEHDHPAAIVGFWLTLRLIVKLLDALSLSNISPQLPHSTSLLLVKNLLRVLSKAPEDMLPWRCRDVVSMQCGVSRRNPVMANGTPHSCITSAASIVEKIVGIANRLELAVSPASQHMERGRAADSPGILVMRREWLCVALDVVDLVNESTDFDELGFDCVFQLSCAIRWSGRKGEMADVTAEEINCFRQQMKLEYLAGMKLTREVVAAESNLCSWCLSELHQSSDCPVTVSPGLSPSCPSRPCCHEHRSHTTVASGDASHVDGRNHFAQTA